MAVKRDYYEVLGVRRDASDAEIRQAFRRLARGCHPDANPDDPSAEERFKELNEAYEALSNPERRAQYDRFGHHGPHMPGGGGGGFDFEGDLGGTLFEWVFGGGGGPEGFRGASRGRDLRADVELTLQEAARGEKRNLTVTRLERCSECRGSGAARGAEPETCSTCGGQGRVQMYQSTFLGRIPVATTCPHCHGQGQLIRQPCPRCQGQGRQRRTSRVEVEIPAGVDDDMRIHVPGQGEAPSRPGRDGQAGDLWVYVHLKPHPVFQRQGRHLVCEVEVSFMRAALGGWVEVPTLDGSVKMRLKPGAQPGDQFRLRGKGLPDPTTPAAPPGDLYAVLRVATPKKLNDRQKQLLRELAESLGEDVDELPEGGEPGGILEWVRNIFAGRAGSD